MMLVVTPLVGLTAPGRRSGTPGLRTGTAVAPARPPGAAPPVAAPVGPPEVPGRGGP